MQTDNKGSAQPLTRTKTARDEKPNGKGKFKRVSGRMAAELILQDIKAREAADEAEKERLTEKARKLPLPQPTTEGKFEARIVQALVEIMTGRPTTAKPGMIKFPETPFEPIVLVLSSTDQFYYRVTASSCSCKGWAYRGKCRHHSLAFPEEAKASAERRQPEARPRMKATSSDDPGESLLSKESFKPFLE